LSLLPKFLAMEEEVWKLLDFHLDLLLTSWRMMIFLLMLLSSAVAV